MPRYFLMYFAFAISTSLTQCSKPAVVTPTDSNTLPPETQTGAGTFACKINGVVWQWKDPNYEFLSTKPKTKWEFDPTSYGGLLIISGVRYSDGITENDLLNIVIDSLNIKKEFNIGATPFWGLRYFDYKNAKTGCQDIASDSILKNSKNFNSSGNLTITRFDKSAKIVSGKFNCLIFEPTCGDTLKFTDGRFDIKYQ